MISLILANIDSDNWLSPVCHRAITWTNVNLLLIGLSGAKWIFNQNWNIFPKKVYARNVFLDLNMLKLIFKISKLESVIIISWTAVFIISLALLEDSDIKYLLGYEVPMHYL